MNKTLTVIACALLMCSCVRTQVAMLDQNTAIISARGTAFDNRAGVVQGTLIEAAKTTVARGYRYFTIVGAEDETRSGTLVIPGQTYSNGSIQGTANTFGNTTTVNGTYSGNSYTTPATIMPFVKPGASITIKMFLEGQIDPKAQGVWDANSVLSANPS